MNPQLLATRSSDAFYGSVGSLFAWIVYPSYTVLNTNEFLIKITALLS